ncbi:MAG TPA: hypothetical protein VGL97_17930 [Bryobacteraceae bacterium]
MAAIGRSGAWPVLLLFCHAAIGQTGQSANVRRCIGSVATALTAGDPADAMSNFDKSFSGYEKLNSYFAALTNSFELGNEIDVTDEQDSATETKLTVHWVLSLTGLQNRHAENRSGDLNIRLVRKGGKWKIVDFSPLDLFNPTAR